MCNLGRHLIGADRIIVSDTIQSILGEIQDIKSQLQIQRPEVKLIDPASGKITGTTTSDVPDLILVTGSLPETDEVAEGASIFLRFRRGQPFKGEPALRWTVVGEKGEIRITSDNGPSFNANSDDVVIEVYNYHSDEVQKVDWEWGSYGELPAVARNIAALYDAYASGQTSNYANFDHALRRHKQLDEILADFDNHS